MQRLIQIVLVVGLLCGLWGCLVPGFADEGYPGYAPYSYGFPVYVGGYAPAFAVHHPWEGHRGEGHHTSFHAAPPADMPLLAEAAAVAGAAVAANH